MNMHMRCLLVVLLGVSGSASAAQPVHPPGLLPTTVARALLQQDPGVAAARAGLEVALHEAGILDKSPYEWTARATGQQRRTEGSQRYNEWNVGVERTIRLPAKTAADRNIGHAIIEESQARVGAALYEAARELMALWLDWLAAERTRELADNGVQSTAASLTAVERRMRAGDASRLDLNIARAELSDQRRLENDARTLASVAWSRLSTRFPGMKPEPTALPDAMPLTEGAAFWRERIVAESDELKIVQAQLRRAQSQAERTRADRMPDPTLGVFTASEIGGRERISGITINIPIPGGARDARNARAVAAVEMSRREIETKKRRIETEIAAAVATTAGAYNSLRIASEGVATVQDNAALMERAYTLGEAELQALLLARRQAIIAKNNALQAQVSALKSYFGLLVDAHLIWNLDLD